MSDNEQIPEQHQGQLGQIVTWRVPEKVALTDLRLALATAGFGQELVADMEPANALRRAFRDMKENRIIRQLRRDGDVLWFQFTAEHLSKQEATYNKEAELTLDVKTGKIVCTVPALRVQAEQLLQENLDHRITTDLTRLVQRIFDAHKSALIAIRDQGGCYFVPDMHREIVEKTKVLLSSIGGKMPSWAVRLGDGDTADACGEATFDHIMDLITEWRETCAGITDETRQDVKDRRIKRADELEQMIRCYMSLLGPLLPACEKALDDGKEELFQALAAKVSGSDSEPTSDESPAEQSELAGALGW